MKSIREIYKVGKGPSSSHTMGPEREAKLMRQEHPEADSFRVVLYGSLSKTGIGHGTDRVLRDTLLPPLAKSFFLTRNCLNPTQTPWISSHTKTGNRSVLCV